MYIWYNLPLDCSTKGIVDIDMILMKMKVTIMPINHGSLECKDILVTTLGVLILKSSYTEKHILIQM